MDTTAREGKVRLRQMQDTEAYQREIRIKVIKGSEAKDPRAMVAAMGG